MDVIKESLHMFQENEKLKSIKKNLKTDLCQAMKDQEEKKAVQKQNDAAMDELHKVGPPMMQEIEHNQNKIEEQKKQVNQMQGDQNYALMHIQRRLNDKKKQEETAEYKQKFQTDLMARLNMRGQKQDSERRMIMTLKKDVREQWASKSPEGKPI